MTIQQDLKQSALPNYIELYTLDLTPIGGTTLYFTPNTIAGTLPIYFGGNQYTPLPITGSGWETSMDGAAPQPSLKVSNVTKFIQAYLTTYKDMVGARVTRTQTFDKYLDSASFPRVNLLNYSQSPVTTTSGWLKVSTTASDNVTTAPDGTSTAGRIVEQALTPSSPYFYITQTVSAGGYTTFTFSTYLKAAERTFANLRFDDGAGVNTVAVGINLTTGVAGAVQQTGIATNSSVVVTDAGSGWWRMAVTGTWSTITNVRTFVRPAIGSTQSAGDLGYAGDITKGIYVWGMQLNQGSTATTYQPTTTVQVNPTADNTQVFNTCVYNIEQKTKQNKYEIEFKLSSIIDTPQMKLPRQQVLRAEFPGAGLFRKQ